MPMDIIRDTEIQQIHQKFSDYPVVAILGPRQCGKTTLSRQFIERYPFSETHFFDLEDPRDNYALDNSMAVLGACQGLVVLDEIQRKPDLFPALRVLADQNKGTKYLILGSSSLELVKSSSESLAGRISFLELGGLSLRDIPQTDFDKLWIRGSFPKSLLARSESASVQWREDFIHTFLEKDIHNLGVNIPAVTMHRFWSMIANYHGQIYNSSEIGRSLGVSEHTSKRYLDILTNTFIVRQILPWYNNTGKRLVKRPKVYFRDTGLLHTLLSLESKEGLFRHPKLGASWEGFALEQTLTLLNMKEKPVYFWATHAGAELDLLIFVDGNPIGIEFTFSETPKITKSMRIAIEDLSLSRLIIISPVQKQFKLEEKIMVSSIQDVTKILHP